MLNFGLELLAELTTSGDELECVFKPCSIQQKIGGDPARANEGGDGLLDLQTVGEDGNQIAAAKEERLVQHREDLRVQEIRIEEVKQASVGVRIDEQHVEVGALQMLDKVDQGKSASFGELVLDAQRETLASLIARRVEKSHEDRHSGSLSREHALASKSIGGALKLFN